MNIVFENREKYLYIKLSGRIDASNSGEFEKQLIDNYNEGSINLVFDLSELDYISSAGLRVFMLAYNNCTNNEKKLCLISPNEIVAEVFEISGLNEMMPVCNSVEEAL